MKIVVVAGARPNFMKISPIIREINKTKGIDYYLVHTGQHYDEKMSDLFFNELKIPRPDVNLGVGSSSHACQTADIMKSFEIVIIDQNPDAVLVVGDVNSTIACGMVAVKMGIKLIHVEAGLRSFDRTMPEEINRILTDCISDYLFCTEQSGVDNLIKEGVPEDKVFLVGNVMIDTLLMQQQYARQSNIIETLGINENNFCVLTLHRPSNVDSFKTLDSIVDALDFIQKDMQIIFPVHPRTYQNIISFGLEDRMKQLSNLKIIEPVGYLDFLKLMMCSKFILTDSGGIQEESVILRKPCITLRYNTERPATVDAGLNQLVGNETDKIIKGYEKIKNGNLKEYHIPPMWDGKTSERIVEILENDFNEYLEKKI